MSILFFLAMVMGGQGDISHARSSALTGEQAQPLNLFGSCEGHGRSIDLHKVMFLENRTVDIDWRAGKLRLSFDGDNFHADEIRHGRSVTQHYRSILDEIENGDDLDIELKFAYFENRLLIYWRETFQNRPYRQGLFEINGPDVAFLCAGRGGRLAVR